MGQNAERIVELQGWVNRISKQVRKLEEYVSGLNLREVELEERVTKLEKPNEAVYVPYDLFKMLNEKVIVLEEQALCVTGLDKETANQQMLLDLLLNRVVNLERSFKPDTADQVRARWAEEENAKSKPVPTVAITLTGENLIDHLANELIAEEPGGYAKTRDLKELAVATVRLACLDFLKQREVNRKMENTDLGKRDQEKHKP